MKKLLLLGGGHAHLSVLESLARQRNPSFKTTLITAGRWQYYSGMLPGWMAGHYPLQAWRIDLRAWAKHAGITLIENPAIGMHADQNSVVLQDGQTQEYDLLSLDTGSEIQTGGLEKLNERLLPVKPLPEYHAAWTKLLDSAASRSALRVLVLGGGAAGVELIMAARHGLMKVCPHAQFILLTGQAGLLPNHAPAVQKHIQQALQAQGISIIAQRGRGVEDGVILEDGTALPADFVIAATGARPPQWLQHSGLALDPAGYVAVDACHRSTSHPNVFAAGDVCSRQDIALARSGVAAVKAGPILAHNLPAALEGTPLQPFLPRKRSLYLLACGHKHAVASWGGLSAQGAWVWHWKDFIDRGFIRRFTLQQ